MAILDNDANLASNIIAAVNSGDTRIIIIQGGGSTTIPENFLANNGGPNGTLGVALSKIVFFQLGYGLTLIGDSAFYQANFGSAMGLTIAPGISFGGDNVFAGITVPNGSELLVIKDKTAGQLSGLLPIMSSIYCLTPTGTVITLSNNKEG